MIFDIIFILLLIPLNIIVTFLQGITNFFSAIVPDSVYNSINLLINYLGMFQGIFPIDTFLACTSTLMIFFGAFYTVKIALWVWSKIPYLGTPDTIAEGNVLDLRSSSNSRNTLDLRRRAGGSKKRSVTMKDIS